MRNEISTIEASHAVNDEQSAFEIGHTSGDSSHLWPTRFTSCPGNSFSINVQRTLARSSIDAVAGTRAIKTRTPIASNASLTPTLY